MTRLFVKYLAIYNNGNLPKSITNYPKYVQYFANNKKPIRKAQRLLTFCQSDEILHTSGHTEYKLGRRRRLLCAKQRQQQIGQLVPQTITAWVGSRSLVVRGGDS